MKHRIIMIRALTLMPLIGMGLLNCGKSEEAAPESAASTTTAAATSTETKTETTKTETSKTETSKAAAAASSLTGGAQVMGAISGALSSVPGTLLIGTTLQLASYHSGDANCTTHGDPLKSGLGKAKNDVVIDGDYLSQSDSSYPAKLFFCLSTLSAAKGASVETLNGALAQVNSVLCSFEKGFGNFEYTTAGTNLVASGPKAVDLTAECWPNGTPEGIKNITFDSAVATALDASTGYQKELKFASSSAGVDYKLKFFNKDGILGFKTVDPGNSPSIGGYSEMTLDSNTGVILVNVVDDRGGKGGADSAYRRVVRLKVKGTLGADLKFSSLEALQGIRTNSGQFSVNPDYFSGATLNGDKDKGFYGQSVAYDGKTLSTNYAGCSGPKTACTATGLLFNSTNTGFYNSRTEWTTHLASGLPPCDDGQDISFAAVPKTGAFGKCAK